MCYCDAYVQMDLFLYLLAMTPVSSITQIHQPDRRQSLKGNLDIHLCKPQTDGPHYKLWRVLVLVAGGQGWWLVVRSRGRQWSVRVIFGAVDAILAKVYVLVLPSGAYQIFCQTHFVPVLFAAALSA